MNVRKSAGRDVVPSHVRHHLFSHPRSGLSVAQYCKRHSISTWSLYQWRKRYQSKLAAPTNKRFSFSDLGIIEHAGCICEIRFASGLTVSVRRGVARDDLATIVDVVASAEQVC